MNDIIQIILSILFISSVLFISYYIIEHYENKIVAFLDKIFKKLFEKPIEIIELKIDIAKRMSINDFDRIWKENGNTSIEIDFDITTSSKKQDFVNFLREHRKEINWEYMGHYCTFDEKVLNEFKDELNLSSLQMFRRKLPEGFIRRWKEDFNMQNILINQELSEDFIRENADGFTKIHWNCISRWQKLSEGFIREFAKKVNWTLIALNQDISLDFVKEFKKKIKWKEVSNDRMNEKLMDKYKDFLIWEFTTDYNHMRMSDKFIEEHERYIIWSELRGHIFEHDYTKKKYKHLIWGKIQKEESLWNIIC